MLPHAAPAVKPSALPTPVPAPHYLACSRAAERAGQEYLDDHRQQHTVQLCIVSRLPLFCCWSQPTASVSESNSASSRALRCHLHASVHY